MTLVERILEKADLSDSMEFVRREREVYASEEEWMEALRKDTADYVLNYLDR